MAWFSPTIEGPPGSPDIALPPPPFMGVSDAIENLRSGTKNKYVRIAAQSEDKKNFDWTADGDDQRLDCTVRWYKRRLVSIAHHWALTFDWGDYKATYEADDDEGYLIPRWKTGGPEQGYEWEEAATFRVKCSRQEVNMMAKQVPINGTKYVLTKINCHAWVQCLTEALDIDNPGINFPEEKWIPEPVALVVDELNSCGFFRKKIMSMPGS